MSEQIKPSSYTYSLNYTRQDGTIGGLIGGRDTLQQTCAGLAHDVAYYEGLGYVVALEWLRANCPECKGAGERAHKSNKLRRITCKCCKGTGGAQFNA